MIKTTTAVVFHGPGRALEVRELPIPRAGGGEVLVEVLACTLCGSDVHTLEGRRRVPVPTILGHEIVGRVAEFGPDARRCDAAGHPLEVGDRVTWAVVASCGACFYCRRLLPQKCERQTKYGHEPLHPGRELTGGLAGHCLLAPGTALFAIAPGLSDAAVCPANCAGATVAAAFEAAGPLEGGRVLVMGAGMLGITATARAVAAGAEVIIACDTAPTRHALAATFGATRVASPAEVAGIALECTDGHGVDVTFEMTGSPDAFETILPLVRMGGSAILVGSVFPARPVPIAVETLVRRCLSLRGIHNYAPRHLQSALEFLAAHPHLPFAELVSDWQPLSELEHALAQSLPTDKLRLGIRPSRQALT